MHMLMTERESLCLKWPSHTTLPLFSANVQTALACEKRGNGELDVLMDLCLCSPRKQNRSLS